jgi:hypothetical protein
MPTGYTAAIQNGISFEKFVWMCARAFGALMSMRDDPQGTPIPTRLEVEPYYQKRLTECRDAITAFDALTDAQFADQRRKERDREAARRAEYRAAKEQQAMLYRDMLARVEAWAPPTPDHTGLKEFMASQIQQSIEWDCGLSYCDAPIPWPTRAEARAELMREFNRADKAFTEESERVALRNAWIDALRASVGEPT